MSFCCLSEFGTPSNLVPSHRGECAASLPAMGMSALPESVRDPRPRFENLTREASEREKQSQLQHTNDPRHSTSSLNSFTSTRAEEDAAVQYPPRVFDISRDVEAYSFYASPSTPFTRPTASSDQLLEITNASEWVERDQKLPTSKEARPSPTQPTTTYFKPREVLFIINVCLAQLLSLAGLAQTVGPVMLSQIFDTRSPGLTAWPTAAYSLTLGSFILPAGRLGDMFGHKRIFLIGWVWFALSSLGCGFSYRGGLETLTACRAVQGIGPALFIPNGLALFGRTFPIGTKRNIAMSLFGGSGPIGFVIGAVVSSLFSQLAWWPWSFWAMAIACTLISILSFFVIPSDRTKLFSKPDAKTWENFDLFGAFTGVSGLVLINFALNQAPIVDWSTAYIGVLLGIGVILLCAFVHIELRVATYPLIPLKHLHRDAAFTLACIAAGWGSHGIWLYYLFLLIEQLRGYSALSACFMVSPVAPIGLTAALAVGILQKRIKFAYLMSVAMLCFVLGSLLLATAPVDQTYFANTLASLIITPIGMNWSFPTGVILMSNAVPREHQGIAASLVSTMVNYSISTGLGFAGSIDRYVTPEHGVLAGYRGAWYFGIGLSTLGFLISLYFISQSRTKK